MLNDFLTLVFGGLATNHHLRLGFFSVIFTGYGIVVKLITDGAFAPTDGTGNRSSTISFVMQELDFVTFVLSELGKVFFIV